MFIECENKSNYFFLLSKIKIVFNFTMKETLFIGNITQPTFLFAWCGNVLKCELINEIFYWNFKEKEKHKKANEMIKTSGRVTSRMCL